MNMMTNKFMSKRNKIRAQMKSRFYYLFWGAATVTVVAGQFYVGSGYRQMARSLDRWCEETIDIMTQPIKPRTGTPVIPDRGGYYMPTPTPEYYNDPMIIR